MIKQALLAALLPAFATFAQAETVVGLVGDDTLAVLDTDSRAVQKTVKVTGFSRPLLGIDVRPADGLLYALAADGAVGTIDIASGKATMKSKLDAMIPAGATATVDFNPVADRLRVIGSDGTNLRANVDDGKVTKDGSLKYAEGDMHKGETPKIVAGAYTNSVKGAKETALFDVDGTIGALVKQAPPNDGVLNAVGKLGPKIETVAFDIMSDGAGGNSGWLVAGAVLHKVDLATGKATEIGAIKGLTGAVRDMAIMPKS